MFDMKYHILHDFGTSTPLNEKSSDGFKAPHILKLLTNFGLNLTSSPGRVMNNVLSVQFITPPW